MKKFLAIFLLLVFAGCDPNDAEINKGNTIDLEAIHGTVTNTWVSWKENGGPYYCIQVLMKNSEGKDATETFKGVPVEKFKLLKVGTILPIVEEYKEDDYGKIEGKIVDFWAFPEENKFMFVLKTGSDFKVCRASPGLYYNKIKHPTN